MGQYADGRPYYAMRFINGDSLQDSINALHRNSPGTLGEKNMQLRGLLGRLIDVCDAIEYAHSRGVLHRDIKPSNIMLGKHGETLVVDWGLARFAKTEDSETTDSENQGSQSAGVLAEPAPTLMGSAVGTPAYMPPEQAEGRLSDIGPQSDVYSLGATLYHILTGRPPFSEQDVPSLLRKVQKGHYPKPRSIVGEIPLPLEAICTHAMSSDAKNRYSTPRELANDLEKFLADEPVSVCPEPWPSRASRWVRKHRALASTAAGILVVTTVGLAAFTVVVGGKNQQLSQLNTSLDTKNRLLDEKNQELDETNKALDEQNTALALANAESKEAKILAEQNEAVAKRQSQLALSTLTSVVHELQNSLVDLPRAGPIRRRILLTSLKQLESLSGEFVEQAAVDETTMKAFLDMGNVVSDYGVGDTQQFLLQAESTAPRSVNLESDVGNSAIQGDDQLRFSSSRKAAAAESAIEVAARFYGRAREIALQLVSEDPSNRELRDQLSVATAKLGSLTIDLGDYQKGLDYMMSSFSIRQELVAEDPDDFRGQLLLSATYFDLGHRAMDVGNLPLAKEHFTSCVALREKLAIAQPDKILAQRQWAIALAALGEALNRLGDKSEALEIFEKSLEVRKVLVEKEPANNSLGRELCVSYDRLASVYDALERTEKSLEMIQALRSKMRELYESDPRDMDNKLCFAISGYRQAFFQGIDAPDSLSLCQNSVKLIEELVAADSANALFKRYLAYGYKRLSYALQAQQRIDEAQDFMEKHASIHKLFVEEDAGSIAREADYSTAIASWALQLSEVGDKERELKIRREGIEFFQRRSTANPGDIERKEHLIDSCRRLLNHLVEEENTDSANKYIGLALDAAKRVHASPVENYQSFRNILVELDRIGKAAVEAKLLNEADRVYAEMHEYATRLMEHAPDDPINQQNFRVSILRLGERAEAHENFVVAEEHFDRYVKLNRENLALTPTDTKSKLGLADALWTSAELDIHREKKQIGFAKFQEAIALYQSRIEVAPETRGFYNTLANRLEDLADVYEELPDLEEAESLYVQAVKVRRDCLATAPSVDSSIRRLANTLNSYGLFLKRQEELESATQAFFESEKLNRDRVSKLPDERQPKRDLLHNVHNIADTYVASDKLELAEPYSREYVELAQQLLDQDANDEQSRRSLYFALSDLASVLSDLGKTDEALRQRRQALDVAITLQQRERSAESRQRVGSAQEDLALELFSSKNFSEAEKQFRAAIQSFHEVGSGADAIVDRIASAETDLAKLLRKQGDLAGAEETLQSSIKNYETATGLSPGDRTYSLGLVSAHFELAAVYQQRDEFPAAIKQLDRSIQILNSFLTENPDDAKFRVLQEKFQDTRETFKSANIVYGDWDELMKRPAQSLAYLLERRGIHFIQKGKAGKAAQAALHIDATVEDPNLHYNAACILSIAASQMADNSDKSKTWTSAAIGSLRRSFELGWKDFEHLENDSDLDFLRKLDSFEELLDEFQTEDSQDVQEKETKLPSKELTESESKLKPEKS